MKTYEVIFQQVVLYRLIVQARDTDQAEQAALDAFGEDDEAARQPVLAIATIFRKRGDCSGPPCPMLSHGGAG